MKCNAIESFLINGCNLCDYDNCEIHGSISLGKIYAKDEGEIKKLHLLVDNILKSNGYLVNG